MELVAILKLGFQIRCPTLSFLTVASSILLPTPKECKGFFFSCRSVEEYFSRYYSVVPECIFQPMRFNVPALSYISPAEPSAHPGHRRLSNIQTPLTHHFTFSSDSSSWGSNLRTYRFSNYLCPYHHQILTPT